MRCVEQVKAPWTQYAAHEIEMFGYVVGMQMFNQLIAENHVNAIIRKFQVVPIINHQYEVLWERCTTTLIGNIYSKDSFYFFGHLECKPTVAWSKL